MHRKDYTSGKRVAAWTAIRAEVVQRRSGCADARLWPEQDEDARRDRRAALPKRWQASPYFARMGGRVHRTSSQGRCSMSGRARANGEGSIFPYRNGFAAYAWVTKPDGLRARKYVYGKTREDVHEKWIKLQQQARDGPVA